MKYKYKIFAYEEIKKETIYRSNIRYKGDSFFKALFVALKLKLQGTYCVVFEWY